MTQTTQTQGGTKDTQTQTWVPPNPSTSTYYQLSGLSIPTQPAGFSTTQANTTKTGDITVSATITLTWVPAAGQTAATDPAPPSVLLSESSSASWTAQVDHYPDPYTTGGTSADNGLQDAEVAIYYAGVKSGGTSSSAFPHYFSQPVTNGVATLSRSFSAHAIASSGPSTAGVNFGCSWGGDTLTVYPMPINISGTYNPTAGDYRVLTGQRITASLTGTIGTVTKYTWAVGGSTFKTYNEKAASNQLVALGPADLTGPAAGSTTVAPLNFYDRAQEDLTVTCAVTMTAPDGKTVLNVTATSPPINVKKPTAMWNVKSAAPLGPQFDPSAKGSMSFAVLWDATITVPSPFSGGYGCFAQIVSPTINFQRHPLGNQSINCYLEEPHINADGTTSYVLPTTGLDTYFPYPASSTAAYPQGYTWDVSAAGQSGDQPGVGFTIPASDNGGNDWYSAFDSNTFTTWLMYKPSSGRTGSPVWVPLQRVDWSWTGNVVKDAATGMWNPARNGNAVTGSSSNTGIPVDAPPQWNTVNVGTDVLRP